MKDLHLAEEDWHNSAMELELELNIPATSTPDGGVEAKAQHNCHQYEESTILKHEDNFQSCDSTFQESLPYGPAPVPVDR